MLVFFWYLRASYCYNRLREPSMYAHDGELAIQFNVSGRPLEAMGWKKCSGCTQ
jgi:hypothetical protein